MWGGREGERENENEQGVRREDSQWKNSGKVFQKADTGEE
jgi:hypothetical protein